MPRSHVFRCDLSPLARDQLYIGCGGGAARSPGSAPQAAHALVSASKVFDRVRSVTAAGESACEAPRCINHIRA